MARRAKRSASDADDFSTIDLEALIRFHVYVRDSEGQKVPLSFRAFMNGLGDHRTMIRTVDGIEARARKLMIIRAILDENGRKTGEYTESFDEVQRLDAVEKRTKRETGAITDYGRAWAAVGGYLHDLIELMIEGGDHPPFLHKVIEEQRATLEQQADRLKESRKRPIGDG